MMINFETTIQEKAPAFSIAQDALGEKKFVFRLKAKEGRAKEMDHVDNIMAYLKAAGPSKPKDVGNAIGIGSNYVSQIVKRHQDKIKAELHPGRSGGNYHLLSLVGEP